MNCFEIVSVDEQNASALVRFFPEDVERDENGAPRWWVGPYNFDIPLGEDGEPISGQALLNHLSNACPDDIIEREKKKRARPKKCMQACADLVGKAMPVRKTSPQLSEVPPEVRPMVICKAV